MQILRVNIDNIILTDVVTAELKLKARQNLKISSFDCQKLLYSTMERFSLVDEHIFSDILLFNNGEIFIG